MASKSRYSKKIKAKAFEYYKQLDGSATAVSVRLRRKYGHDAAPSTVTVLKWAEKYDWDGSIEKAKELVRETLSQSDDPTVKQMVKDDVFMGEVVGILMGVVMETFKKRKSKFVPRNSNELIKMLGFIHEMREKLMGMEKPKENTAKTDITTIKQALRDILGETPEGVKVEASLIRDLRSRMRVIEGGRGGQSKTG